jgi:hypothetical protein
MYCYLTGLGLKGDKLANSSALSYATSERKVASRSTVLIALPLREEVRAQRRARGAMLMIDAMLQHRSRRQALATHDVIPDLIRDPS